MNYTRYQCDAELALAFNYEAEFEDRRCMAGNGSSCPDCEGRLKTYRGFLGEGFFEQIQRCKTEGVDRIVFWFNG